MVEDGGVALDRTSASFCSRGLLYDMVLTRRGRAGVWGGG